MAQSYRNRLNHTVGISLFFYIPYFPSGQLIIFELEGIICRNTVFSSNFHPCFSVFFQFIPRKVFRNTTYFASISTGLSSSFKD
jgi:hypothetical protein